MNQNPSPKILVVDDERIILNTIKAYLQKENYQVRTASTGPEALTEAETFQPHLIILDLMLPEIDGLEILQQLRQRPTNDPLREVYVLLLTAKSEEFDKVVGLMLGADDYMTKPFSPRELVARIKAILRRHRQPETSSQLTFNHLTIDKDARLVWQGNKRLELTKIEFDLLETLVLHHGQVLSREQLIEQVWGHDYYGDDRVVDVYIGRLRKKIEKEPTQPILVTTVRGIGYRFEDTPL